MASQISIASARRPVRWIWVALVFLLWAGYNARNFYAYSEYLRSQRVFAYERLISAGVLAAQKANAIPERLRPIIGAEVSDFIDDIDDYCETGLKHGEFPVEAMPDWALAHFLIGSKDRARDLLAMTDQAEAGSIDYTATADELVIVTEFIEGGDVSAANLARARTALSNNLASWPVLYILATLDDPEEYALTDWMDGVADEMISEGAIATSLMLLAEYLGLLCVVIAVLSRHRFPAPLPHFRLPSAWKASSILFVLFVSLLISNIAFTTIMRLLDIFYLYDVGLVIGTVVFVALPAVWFVARFTPGWRAARRLFGGGTGSATYPASWIFLLALGAAGVTLLIDDIAINLLSIDAAHLHPEDWIVADYLDRPINLILGLFMAVFAAPIFEEMIFRGFVFGALRTKTRISPLLAAILSSAIFATIHWYSMYGWVTVFISGLIFCWLYHRTNSLWPGIICHGIYNLVVVYYAQAWYSF